MHSNCKRYGCMSWSCEFTSESDFNLGRHELKCRHKKRHCLDTAVRRNETVKSKCDRQW